MHIQPVLQMVMLLTVANGAPLVAKKICGNRFRVPLDFGITFFDGRPVFGSSKTIRGIVVSIIVTAACAPLIGLKPTIGAMAAGAAMAGDLFSSFLKRRMVQSPSSQALGIDQIPESLLPMLVCRDALQLTGVDIVFGVGIFFAAEIVLSRLLFRLHLRDEPY